MTSEYQLRNEDMIPTQKLINSVSAYQKIIFTYKQKCPLKSM